MCEVLDKLPWHWWCGQAEWPGLTWDLPSMQQCCLLCNPHPPHSFSHCIRAVLWRGVWPCQIRYYFTLFPIRGTSNTSNWLGIITLCILNPKYASQTSKNAASKFWKVTGFLAGTSRCNGEGWESITPSCVDILWVIANSYFHHSLNGNRKRIHLSNRWSWKETKPRPTGTYNWCNQSQSIILSVKRKEEKCESIHVHVSVWWVLCGLFLLYHTVL